jgi:hypothetical protein
VNGHNIVKNSNGAITVEQRIDFNDGRPPLRWKSLRHHRA